MANHRYARDYAAMRLRDEAGELMEQTKREPNFEIRQEMVDRADLLERTAEMLDMATPQWPEV
jgi:hypothetical protein